MGRANDAKRKISRNKKRCYKNFFLSNQKKSENIASGSNSISFDMNTQEENTITNESSQNYDQQENIELNYVVTPEICKPQITIEGRRIVDLFYFLNKLKEISNHGNHFGCSLNNLEIIKEEQRGLQSMLFMKCNMCGVQFKVPTNDPCSTKMDINTGAVSGIISVGGGYYNLEELLASMNIPNMSLNTFHKIQKEINTAWENTATQCMKEAVKKEADYAIQVGNVNEIGIPLITVVGDGCWSRRSYGSNYKALSGVGALIGFHFKEVLFIGVKNKYCMICDRNSKEREGRQDEHTCFKNFSGSSASMESEIIVEGFRNSLSTHGVIFNKLIADGDSSTYKKILEARPYENITVQKIECRNHILRCFCRRLQKLATDTHYNLLARKDLKSRIMRMRTHVVCAIAYRKQNSNKSEASSLLQKDIKNSISHEYGKHDNCATYFCKKKDCNRESECRMYILDNNPEFAEKLNQIIDNVARQSGSLIYDVDSNIVEQYNSVIAKFVGGKRINYTSRGSYKARCSAAAVSWNTKKPHNYLHQTLYSSSPSKVVKKFENRRQRIIFNMQQRRSARRILFAKKKKSVSRSDPDYGEHCQKPDMNPEEYKVKSLQFLQKLEKSEQELIQLEIETRNQANSCTWLEERRKILTASNFHSVCRRRPTTSCANLVKNLLYNTAELNTPAINHGKLNESKAIQKIELQENINIRKCGLFIHKDIPFLGASPDGIIEPDMIVEVKCPFSAYNMSIKDAIKEKKVNILKLEGEKLIINENDKWYYQIQGQLQVTGKNTCLLGIWTGENFPITITYIQRNDSFWQEKMEQQLIIFYKNCILPELVDPRIPRNMQIKDPEYIIQAQKQIRKAKTSK